MPPPLKQIALPVPLIGPEKVRLLPAAAVTARLPSTATGTAMVWFPPLMLTAKAEASL